jgi:serine/threonine-protein kinase
MTLAIHPRVAARRWWSAVTATAVLAVCLGAGSACNRGGSDEAMPDVVGKPEAEAKRMLEEMGLTVTSTKKRTGAAVGSVIDQSPHAGDPTPDDLEVALVIEDAAATGTAGVPDVIGKSMHDAEELLTQAGFRRGNLVPQISSQPKDTVLDQNPKAGSNAAAGTLVDLIVADSSMAAVPNVVGQTEANAIKLLTDQRLRIGNVRRALEGAGAAGLVLDQNPRAEVMVAFETPVDLVIKEDSVRVPAVENKLLDDVATTLLASGLVYKLGYRFDPARPFGTILSLTPAGGQLVPRNSEVAVTVARPKRPVLDWGVADIQRLKKLERFELQMKSVGPRKPQ